MPLPSSAIALPLRTRIITYILLLTTHLLIYHLSSMLMPTSPQEACTLARVFLQRPSIPGSPFWGRWCLASIGRNSSASQGSGWGRAYHLGVSSKNLRTGSPKHHTIMKATISIAALAMVYASASAWGLCGGPVVGYGSTYYTFLSLFLQTKHTPLHFCILLLSLARILGGSESQPLISSSLQRSCSMSWWPMPIARVVSGTTRPRMFRHWHIIFLWSCIQEGNKYCDCRTDFMGPRGLMKECGTRKGIRSLNQAWASRKTDVQGDIKLRMLS